jgi:MFS family permease
MSDATRTSSRAWLVWGLAVTAYAIAVFQRASLGVSAVQAQDRFDATAAQLGLLGVMQLVVYAGLQIPVGVLADRYGSRRLIALGALVMGAGQLVLATTHAIGGAVAGRVLVGCGDALTFICVLRLVTVWFAPGRIALVTQLTGTIGQVGSIAAAYPLVALLQHAGWTASFTGSGVLGVIVAAVVLAFIRDAPPGAPPRPAHVSLREALETLGHAWREPGTRLGLWTHFVTQFSGMVFALLWGYPFLVVGEGRSPGEAGALLTLLVLAGMAVGPVLGSIAGRWPYRRSVPVLAIVGATAGMWTVVLAWPGRAPLAVLVLLILVLATNGPGSIMGFDFARTENEPARVGSATGIVNVGGFTASLLTIFLIGVVLTAVSGGATRAAYTLGDLRAAMAVQYLFWAVGLAGVLIARRRLRALRGIELDTFPAAVRRLRRRSPTDPPGG